MCLHHAHHLDLHTTSIKYPLPIHGIRFSANTTPNIHFTIAFAYLSLNVLHPISPLISCFCCCLPTSLTLVCGGGGGPISITYLFLSNVYYRIMFVSLYVIICLLYWINNNNIFIFTHGNTLCNTHKTCIKMVQFKC